MYMRDYPTLHLDTNSGKGTAGSKNGYGCKWRVYCWIVSHVHLHPYPVLLPAVPLL
jgi:hypothetical protein